MKKICMMLFCLVLMSSCSVEDILLTILSQAINGSNEVVETDEITRSGGSGISSPNFYAAINNRDANKVKQFLIHEGFNPNYCNAREGWPESNPLAVVARGQYTSYDEKRMEVFLDPMPDIEVFQILIEAGADVNRRPYVWQKVYTRDNGNIQWARAHYGNTQEVEDAYIADANRVLKAFLEAGADPDALGHPYPFSRDALRQPRSVDSPGITEEEARQYFAQGTRAINEAIKKGIKWESQVDLLLQYTSLDEDSLVAAKESGDSAMIEKINLLWENKDDFFESAFDKPALEGDFEYSIKNDGASIVRYIGRDRNLIIPEKINGYDVTSIGNSAFVNTWLESVTIPTSVRSIGNYAFAYNINLTTIEIPHSVRHIGSWAFLGSWKLTDIKIPEGNSVYEFIDGILFDKEKNMLHTYLNSNNEPFYAIPDSIIYIGNGAFAGSESLESIEIPDSVISIGAEAFFSCNSLTTVEIPSSVISIGDNAFSSCYWLTSVTTTPTVNPIENTTIFPNLAMGMGNKAFYACWDLETIEISSSITSIGNNAFQDCKNLIAVTIPASVTSIGNYAFAKCELLITIEIPDSVESIGSFVFSECKSLITIKIPDSVTSIGAGTFYWCESLASVEISNSVKSIGEQFFWGCGSLTEIEIPDSVTSIGNEAFRFCDGLTEIEIPDSVTSIGESAFRSCENLSSITIPDSVTSIGDNAFRDCESLESIEIGNSVTSIGKEAFSECESLTEIKIPDSVTSIGEWAFGVVSRNLTLIVTAGSHGYDYAWKNRNRHRYRIE